MCTLDQDTLEIIIRTDANIVHILNELEAGKTKFEKIETRLRKIESIFLPTVLFIGVLSSKIFKWMGL
jgi:hypothetical protein